MRYEQFIKKLATPPGFTVPTRLSFEHLHARAITRADLAEDVRGINDSLELIARTRGGGWPTEPVTEAINFVDLVWHELEFRDGYSFTYAVYDKRNLPRLLPPVPGRPPHRIVRSAARL